MSTQELQGAELRNKKASHSCASLLAAWPKGAKFVCGVGLSPVCAPIWNLESLPSRSPASFVCRGLLERSGVARHAFAHSSGLLIPRTLLGDGTKVPRVRDPPQIHPPPRQRAREGERVQRPNRRQLSLSHSSPPPSHL